MIRVIVGRYAICTFGKAGGGKSHKSISNQLQLLAAQEARQLEEGNSLEIQSDESGFLYCRGGCVLVEK
jgi:hypothetical protein